MRSVLVINAGSTSLKLHLVHADESATPVDTLEQVDGSTVEACAHRIVHGGRRFREPVLIDAGVREAIFELETLAPLHNAPALRGIEAAERAFPTLPQIAVFDTEFHATLPEEAAVYALPRRWREELGVRRYGFHGLSVAWSAERAPMLLGQPVDRLRLVVCHLGGGCSVTAVRGGSSVDTTMGFSPLEGVPGATRSGSIDPGALVYLLREDGLEADELERILNLDAGLRGIAGGSGSMLELERRAQSGDADATLAIDVFVHRAAAEAAAMATAAGGVDAVVFTAGIGENSALIRRRVGERLRFLGVELDDALNAVARPDCDVAAATSAVRVLVIRAREEIVAARAARALLAR